MTRITAQAEIDIDDDELDTRIIAAAADSIIGTYGDKYRLAQAAIQKAVDKRAEELVVAFFAKGIQPVNGVGDPTGPRIPTEEYLANSIKGWMEIKVNENGEPKIDSYSTKMTRIEWLLKKHALDGIASIVSKEVAAVRDEAKKAIHKQVANSIATLLANGKS